MHLLTIVIFAHSVKIQRTFFYINKSINFLYQKKQRLGPNLNDNQTAIFCWNEKVQIV